MKNVRVAAAGSLVMLLLSLGVAQNAGQHLLSADELKNVVPAEFFFRGKKAPTQLRNATGFQMADGKVTFGALVDASGYSTAIQEKYQGMLITESKLNIGGSELAPGEYGFGFTADRFVVMNVAAEDGRGWRWLQAIRRKEMGASEARVSTTVLIAQRLERAQQTRDSTAPAQFAEQRAGRVGIGLAGIGGIRPHRVIDDLRRFFQVDVQGSFVDIGTLLQPVVTRL